MSFAVGDRVILIEGSNLEEWNEYEDDVTRGVVKRIDHEGVLTVKWDNKWRTPNPSPCNAEDLMSEEEANKILSKLEKEYEAWAGPIREKIEEAAKLLTQAGKLAAKQDKDLTEMSELVGPLLSAMDDCGWSTSSLSC